MMEERQGKVTKLNVMVGHESPLHIHSSYVYIALLNSVGEDTRLDRARD